MAENSIFKGNFFYRGKDVSVSLAQKFGDVLECIHEKEDDIRKKEDSSGLKTVNVQLKLDAEVKRSMEQVCSELGLSINDAFTIFAKKVSIEKRIPFEVNLLSLSNFRGSLQSRGFYDTLDNPL